MTFNSNIVIYTNSKINNMTKKLNLNHIENKIKDQFKLGVDYTISEKYHASYYHWEKGYYTKTYEIKSPLLREKLWDWLTDHNTPLLSFDFSGKIYLIEHDRNNNEKRYQCSYDEFGNPISLSDNHFTITYTERKKNQQEFIKNYQVAKEKYEVKRKNGWQPRDRFVPPTGTKCWYCYQVISDYDIKQGKYKCHNSRFYDEKNIYREFTHVKGHGCHAQAYDPAHRNNYRYHDSWEKKWQEKGLSSHEYSCRDCLNKIRQEILGNLIYLETWEKEALTHIIQTKKIINEIAEALAQLEKTGNYQDCGIKKCCPEHDRPQGDSHQHNSQGNSELMATGTGKPKNKKPLTSENAPALTDNFLTELLSFMKKQKINQIAWNPTNKQLIAEYNDNTQKTLTTNLLPNGSQLVNYWQNSQNLNKLSLSQADLTRHLSQLQANSFNIEPWIFPLSVLGISVFLILFGIILSQKKKKKIS